MLNPREVCRLPLELQCLFALLLLQLYRSASLCFLLACFQRQQEPDFSQKALINWLYTLPAQLQTAGTVRDSAVNIAEHLTSRAPGISLRC